MLLGVEWFRTLRRLDPRLGIRQRRFARGSRAGLPRGELVLPPLESPARGATDILGRYCLTCLEARVQEGGDRSHQERREAPHCMQERTGPPDGQPRPNRGLMTRLPFRFASPPGRQEIAEGKLLPIKKAPP